MVARKNWNVDVLIDVAMVRLFYLAEYICNRFSFVEGELVSSINEDGTWKG